jgi:hypothetical protein
MDFVLDIVFLLTELFLLLLGLGFLNGHRVLCG